MFLLEFDCTVLHAGVDTTANIGIRSDDGIHISSSHARSRSRSRIRVRVRVRVRVIHAVIHVRFLKT
jgi:hypothetical protein